MPATSTMLQLSVIQELDQDVSKVEPFFAEVFESLILGTVTVREIAVEKTGGVQGNNSAIPIDARRPVSLVGQTAKKQVPLSPVLVSCGDKQKVTFDGEDPATFLKRRRIEIGCPAALAEDAGRGRARLLRESPTHLPSRYLRP